MGVSICLDLVSIESLDLDDVVKEWVLTASKSASRQLRNIGRDRDFSILSWHQWPDQKVSIEIKKFVEIWKFRHFLTVCLHLDFCIFSSRLFIIFRLKRPRQCWDFSTNLDWVSTNLNNLNASWQILTIWTCLDNLDKNLDVSKSRLKSLNFKNLDWEKKSWSRHDGHSRRFSIVSLDTKDVTDFDLDWSRQSRPPCLSFLKKVFNFVFQIDFWIEPFLRFSTLN